MKRLALTLGSSVALFLVGCGGVSTFSCDRTNNSSQPTCTDYTGVSGDTGEARSQCTQGNGTIGTTCDTANAIGGCRFTAPAGEQGSVTVWYYFGTADQIRQACGTISTFVTPP